MIVFDNVYLASCTRLCRAKVNVVFIQVQKYSWHEAMERLVQGYQEVIEQSQTLKLLAAVCC